jgi:hypothetical protein
MDKAYLVNTLMAYTCNVTFTKVNGEKRVMQCTLRPDVVPVTKNVNKSGGMVVPVWDVENNGWRSFRIDTVTDFEIINIPKGKKITSKTPVVSVNGETVDEDTIFTVREAAKFSGVGTASIYYHIGVSKKLPLILKNRQYFVSKKALERVYQTVTAGKKQHVTKVKPLTSQDKKKIKEYINFLKANGYVVLTEV